MSTLTPKQDSSSSKSQVPSQRTGSTTTGDQEQFFISTYGIVPADVTKMGSLLSTIFGVDANSVSKIRSAYHITYDRQGSPPQTSLRDLTQLKGWTGTIVSISESQLVPTIPDDPSGPVWAATQAGGQVILWDSDSMVGPVGITHPVVEVTRTETDGIASHAEQWVRIKGSVLGKTVASNWLEVKDEKMKYVGDTLVWCLAVEG